MSTAIQKLRLQALDHADLSVISTHTQDAVIKLADLQYMSNESRFVMVMNRFDWQADTGKRGLFALFRTKPKAIRHRSALSFSRVSAARHKNLNMTDTNQSLALLAILFAQVENGPDGVISLIFSGGAEIALDVECIEAELHDLAGTWETHNLPRHDLIA